MEDGVVEFIDNPTGAGIGVSVEREGTWGFDKKRKRKIYVSATGKVCHGAEAMKMAKLDMFRRQWRMLLV